MAITDNSCFCQTVSEEKNLKNEPIRNKNRLWWPYLLTDQDEMSNLNRGLSIDASYQVSVHLAKRFRRRRFKKIDQWLPQTILVSDWLISKKSSPLKPLCQMHRNLVGSI
jgi:hypothetical protein